MRPSNLLRTIVAPALLVAALCAAPIFAAAPPKPGDDPAAKPAAPGAPGTLVDPAGDPAKAPKIEEKAKVQTTPEAQEVLNGIRDSYSKLKTLSLTGKLSADLDIDGTKKNDSVELSASYAAPNFYRHVLKGNVEAGSTGEKVYAYQPGENVYVMKDAPADLRRRRTTCPVRSASSSTSRTPRSCSRWSPTRRRSSPTAYRASSAGPMSRLATSPTPP